MQYVLFACGVSILFFATVQLTARNKQPMHYCMVITCLGAGYIYMYLWAFGDGLILSVPAFANSDSAAMFAVAPAFYLASLSVLHEGRRPVRSYSVYFVLPVLLAIGSVLYNAITAPGTARAGIITGHFSSPATTIVTICAVSSLTVVIVLDLFAARRLHKAGRVRDRAGFRHQVIFLFCYLAASLIALSSCVFRNDTLYAAAILPVCPIIMAYALSRTAVFYFPQGRPRPLLRGRPERDSAAQELTARLAALMETAAPFRDETLTLRKLAGMLGEEPKRLSYHLNVNLSTSFRRYVSELRLAAVCRDLLQEPDRSILDIAFGNGFNSKSSFNTLFFGKYGMTPRDFKRKNLLRR